MKGGKRRAENFLRRFFAEPAHLGSTDGRIPSSGYTFQETLTKDVPKLLDLTDFFSNNRCRILRPLLREALSLSSLPHTHPAGALQPSSISLLLPWTGE